MVGWGKTKTPTQPQPAAQPAAAPKQAVNVPANNEIEQKFIEAIESMGINDVQKVSFWIIMYILFIYRFYE